MWVWILWTVLGLASLVQVAAVLAYLAQARRAARRPTPTAERWPHISVFVPVRGGGLRWKTALEHLLALNYPNFDVCVVVDHSSDPAAAVVESMLEHDSGAKLKLLVLDKPATHRSLLCSGLVQFFEQLAPSTELVAFCGADIHLPTSFFRDMAAPMMDRDVGTTLGNRWYRPHADSWGSIVRYLWNVGAVVPMWVARIPWGGASILRPEDIRKSGLLDNWANGMVEDAPIKAAMERLGLKLQFVPKLLVVEEDPIDFVPCRDFINRQILWTKLYHPHWWFVTAHAAFATGAMFIPWLVSMGALCLGMTTLAIASAVAGALYWICQGAMVAVLEYAARSIVTANGQHLPPMDWTLIRQIFLGIPLAQLTYAESVFHSMRREQVQWSGIQYEIKGPYDIRLLNYHPVAQSARASISSSHDFRESEGSAAVA